MEKHFFKTTGINLLLGALLMIFAMGLHPTGGSIEHMQKVKFLAMTVHTIAIMTLPILGFGSWGLATALVDQTKITYLSLGFTILGLAAGLVAATINGLTLPIFISNLPQNYDLETVKLILRYGRYINMPMDYIMVGTFSCSIAIWSYLIFKTKKLPKFLAYLGYIICILGFISHFFHIDFASLWGFRAFVVGIGIWYILISVYLIKFENK